MQTVVIPDACFQEAADQRNNTPVAYPLRDLPGELVVVHSIEKFFEIHIHDIPNSRFSGAFGDTGEPDGHCTRA
jgi:hypothetical protein